jgi:hypothetical protein
MGKKDAQSRDQKRKAKLRKRAKRSNKHVSMAYSGQKYQSEEFVTVMHRTEVGIYESYVIGERELTDTDVESALENLIGQMRKGSLPQLLDPDPITTTDDDEEDLVIGRITSQWRILAERDLLPGRDDLIGVLRTLLHSLEVRRGMSLHAQGYLRFLEGFMKQTGVSVERVGSEYPL